MNKVRQFNMTFAELADKLTIDQIKEVLLAEKQAKNYASEIKQLEHDIDLMINEKEIKLSAEFIRMLILLAQANLHVWYIKDEMMDESDNYIELLRFAQELNGVRNHIKNLILEETEEVAPTTRRATFLNYKCNEWYTNILESLKNMDK